MSYEREFYLVRHGKDDYDGLNIEGREHHAPFARDQLLAKGLGSSTILLTSNTLRALQTAQIIGKGLGVEAVLSNTINLAGNNARVVSDLDAIIEQALQEANIEIDPMRHDLVVVTHAPMLAIARGVPIKDIGHGEVFTYARNSWNNPNALR